MVRLGILCEGESETYIVKSEQFQNWILNAGLELVGIRPVGSKNQYWEDRFESHLSILNDLNCDQIIILVDLDNDSCITETKRLIKTGINQHVIVSVKEFENWFLADFQALGKLVSKEVYVEFPEMEDEPVRKIIELNNGKGFGGSKPRLAVKMRNNGFSIQNAAEHPNCPSARYFLDKLQKIVDNQD